MDPGCVAAYSGLGRLYQDLGDQERAEQTYRHGLEQLPQNAALRFELGMCQAQQKHWQPALDNFKAALDLDPDNDGYAKTLGFCLGRMGRYDESFAYLKRAVGEAQAHYDLARVLYHVHEDALSKEHAARALALKPDMVPAKQLLTELENPSQPAAQSSVAAVGFETVP